MENINYHEKMDKSNNMTDIENVTAKIRIKKDTEVK